MELWITVFSIVAGLCVRLGLNYFVRPYLVLLQDRRIERIIKERRAALMALVNDKSIRNSISSKQRQLRVLALRGEPGDGIAAEMRSLAQDAVDTAARAQLGGHADR